MTRAELEEFIQREFNVKADYPFEHDTETGVFRHTSNKKWFAIAMHIQRKRIGLSEDGYIDIFNVKCGKEIIDSMLQESGIFPAYHMNKSNWLSIALDGSANDEIISFLLNVSFELTKK